MGQDVSAELAGVISGSKVFDSSDNIRHGRYRFGIRRIFAELIENDKGTQKMAFWEFTVIKSEPNPQVEGDHTDYPNTSGPLIDDGTKPNPVGSRCALKVNFDGPGARAAGGNIKAAILALFGKRDGEIPDEEVNATWIDLSRQKDLHVGDFERMDPKTNQPILAKKAKKANPACGMVIDCVTVAKKKKKANEKGAYITKLIWTCAALPNTGENSEELVKKRAADYMLSMEEDDEAEETAASAPGAQGIPTAPVGTVPGPLASAPPLPTPPAPAPTPPAPPAVFTPAAPWELHPDKMYQGATPDTRWYWSNPARGGDNALKTEAQLRG